uniref:Sushi domain-containing protein n=1 Tax=Biomphalaria glabrata TaxID=6526 RepID=A0A2C9LX18_BIOGL
MGFKDILITICIVSWITCSLLDARNIPVKRNVETDMCPTPTVSANGQVDCEYSDALQIEIYCTISCKTGYIFDKSQSKDFVFPCDVATGFFDKPITPDCIPIHESTLVPPLG